MIARNATTIFINFIKKALIVNGIATKTGPGNLKVRVLKAVLACYDRGGALNPRGLLRRNKYRDTSP
jgi:hypothetical protein